MTEFIGSRISLISKRDIRYVGTLHEISSENSTVALEQVVSFGTEGRRPDDEVLPSDNVYEYIVFRGSDVKDLRIEEPPKENKPPKPPQVPDDPAILGSARRLNPSNNQSQLSSSQPLHPQPQDQQPPQGQINQQSQQRQAPPPQFQPPPFPYYYPPPNQRFGPQGFPPGPGFPGMPYGAPPGWYPPPGHGFPPHMPAGQFHHNQMPVGPQPPLPNQKQPQTQSQPVQPNETASVEENRPALKTQSPTPTATVKLPSSSTTPVPPLSVQQAPPPPTESKPDVAAALAPPAPSVSQVVAAITKPIPTGPKSGRIVPAVPLPSPNVKAQATADDLSKLDNSSTSQPAASQAPPQPITTKPIPITTKTIEEANRDARAAVAAAMAKLPPAPGQRKQIDGQGTIDNLTKRVNEMRANDNTRASRQPGTGRYAAGHRGAGRGAYRGGRALSEQQGRKIEVPTTDYDFASANAKFNKQDLVKEAITSGSPIGSPIERPVINGSSTIDPTERSNGIQPVSSVPTSVGYNRSSSFFDNISSESKDRTEEGGNRLGGRELRSEERQKNVETFGQGSVDNGYRSGFGRARGRGRGYARGIRGGYGPRGGARGARGGRGTIATEG